MKAQRSGISLNSPRGKNIIDIGILTIPIATWEYIIRLKEELYRFMKAALDM